MITILEYAFLSAHVYGKTENNNIRAIAIPSIDSKRLQYGWAYMTDVDPNTVDTNHFFAQLYLKFDNGKATDAVVAVRGTIFTDKTNLGVDILSWYADVLGAGNSDSTPLVFTNALISFVIKAQAYVRRYFPNIPYLKFTGHSLGGALAQLMPLKAGFAGPAVVFNSPGVGHIPGVMPDKLNWVTNINSRYGVINKIGGTIGNIYLIDIPEMEAQAKQLFAEMDQTNFAKSDYIYQLADQIAKHKILTLIAPIAEELANGIGLGYRLMSYRNTYDNIEQQPQTAQNVAVNCTATPSQPWYNLKARLAIKICATHFISSKLNQIITAQHSIDNMVFALQLKQNAQVAYTAI